MPHNISWAEDRNNPKVKNLICQNCMSGRFLISHTTMARQVKTRTAHHMRLVARCARCKEERRIGFKG